MNLKTICIAFIMTVPIIAAAQNGSETNITDQQGRKQGHWIKYYPDSTVMYDGFFKDDHPVGEFRRYYNDKTLKSLLVYSSDGREANAEIFHPNGFIESKGKYVNQLKEGKWQFFSISINGYLILEEYYSKNIRNGPSVKYYPDGTIAEKKLYKNDIAEGEWIKYYPNGKICLKSSYLNGKIEGPFEVWFENGSLQFSGRYKNDSRDGLWLIYNTDGTVKYKINYVDGFTEDRQMDIDESDYLDSLDQNRGKIADPEKTGVIR